MKAYRKALFVAQVLEMLARKLYSQRADMDDVMEWLQVLIDDHEICDKPAKEQDSQEPGEGKNEGA